MQSALPLVSLLFLDVTQCIFVVSYWHLRTVSSSLSKASNKQSTLYKISVEWKSNSQCIKSLKSWITITIIIFQAWSLHSYWMSMRRELFNSRKIILEGMIGNVVIPEVNDFRYVILIKAEKHMHYGELVLSEKCIML